jgi:hypothetical protein
MTDFPIVELTGAVGVILAAMWAMFRSLQKGFLEHLNKSDVRMVELLTTKNGHMERIAKEFNSTVREFQGVVSKISEQVDSIDKRI